MHLHLWERGILHRDISWYNVLCNPVVRFLSLVRLEWRDLTVTPQHDPATDRDKTTLERPCIDKILFVLML